MPGPGPVTGQRSADPAGTDDADLQRIVRPGGKRLEAGEGHSAPGQESDEGGEPMARLARFARRIFHACLQVTVTANKYTGS